MKHRGSMATADPRLAARSRDAKAPPRRLRVTVRGLVQGVGFRPFVYRRAVGHRLAGWVVNGREGVVIELEGPSSSLDSFLDGFAEAAPPNASIEAIDVRPAPVVGGARFRIRE